ncbi:hypothetical protein [Deinococcus sp. Marseille-Q6407]|uniref:hypothetical protein n=1 Tax=Deinococcus sp. Marseille-Q6407 TaxID=2969223 RepID=UPI0021BE6A02|nr:hypothetical protein [Deinococcus sp. Marseille-Q6407]
MGRRERFSQYEWAAWPDEGLQQAYRVPFLEDLAVVRVDWRQLPFTNPYELQIDVWPMTALRPERLLKLTWTDRVYALELYPEEYSQPFAETCSWRGDSPDSSFLEVMNDPDPWVTEILLENPSYGVFPLGGRPVQVHPDTWERNKGNEGWETPTGRFSPPGSCPAPLALSQEAELEQPCPRYRHLFISSLSMMVEILCEGLPRWEWVEIPEGN